MRGKFTVSYFKVTKSLLNKDVFIGKYLLYFSPRPYSNWTPAW